MLRILAVGEKENERAREPEDGEQIGRWRGGWRCLGEECLIEGVKVRAWEEGGATNKRAEAAV